jgi:hypothetical protein
MRFFTPVLLLCAAGFLHVYNPTETGGMLLFPFIGTLVPSTAGDPMAQARASEWLLIGFGLLSLAFAVWRMQREKAED